MTTSSNSHRGSILLALEVSIYQKPLRFSLQTWMFPTPDDLGAGSCIYSILYPHNRQVHHI
jgi:hypothetical protein